MKVIDLLNKIANGEDVPKKIKHLSTNYIYDSENQIYYKENYQELGNYGDLLMELSSHKGHSVFNDEIEILEDIPKVQVEMTQEEYFEYLDKKLDTPKEDKKIEKLDNNIAYCVGTYETRWNDSEMYIVDKLNEIIDRLNGKNNE